MKINTTTEFEFTPGKRYFLAIANYNGHTTTLQYQPAESTDWEDVLDVGGNAISSAGSPPTQGEFRAPTRNARILVAPGTGDLDVDFREVI